MVVGVGLIFRKFQADRGPYLAAMIAHYALLSFVPLTFIALSMLGFFGHAKASDSLVKKLTSARFGLSVRRTTMRHSSGFPTRPASPTVTAASVRRPPLRPDLELVRLAVQFPLENVSVIHDPAFADESTNLRSSEEREHHRGPVRVVDESTVEIGGHTSAFYTRCRERAK